MVNLLGIGLVAVVVLSGWAAPAGAAEEGLRFGEDRWAPSLAVVSGVTFQLTSAGVSSFDGTGTALRPSNFDDEWAVSPYVGADLRLMTPTLPLPGRPRLFLSGQVLPSFGRDRQTAKEGDPGPFQPPTSVTYPDTAVPGQGSATTGTLDTWIFGAGLGIAFPFDLRGRRLWIKPSIGWLRYKMDVVGEVRDVQCTPFPRPPPQAISTECGNVPPNPGQFPPNPGFVGFQRDVILSSQESQYFNGLGPGLELEMIVGRFGPIASSLFLDAHAYNILGNRKISMTSSASFPRSPDGTGHPPTNPTAPGTLPPADLSGAWTFEVDPWMFRAGGGIRFQWLGFD